MNLCEFKMMISLNLICLKVYYEVLSWKVTCKLGELADPDPEQIISNCLGALFNNPGMSSILIFGLGSYDKLKGHFSNMQCGQSLKNKERVHIAN